MFINYLTKEIHFVLNGIIKIIFKKNTNFKRFKLIFWVLFYSVVISWFFNSLTIVIFVLLPFIFLRWMVNFGGKKIKTHCFVIFQFINNSNFCLPFIHIFLQCMMNFINLKHAYFQCNLFDILLYLWNMSITVQTTWLYNVLYINKEHGKWLTWNKKLLI